MNPKTRRILGNFMIAAGLAGVLINSVYLAYFANPAILQGLAKRSLIFSIIFVILMVIGGAWGMKKERR